jgi:hypothetical protein
MNNKAIKRLSATFRTWARDSESRGTLSETAEEAAYMRGRQHAYKVASEVLLGRVEVSEGEQL